MEVDETFVGGKVEDMGRGYKGNKVIVVRVEPLKEEHHRQLPPGVREAPRRLSGELEFRFNNRDNPHMFRDAMCKLLVSNSLPYAKLIKD